MQLPSATHFPSLNFSLVHLYHIPNTPTARWRLLILYLRFYCCFLFSNLPFPIVDSALRMVPSDVDLSLSSFFVSPPTELVRNLFSMPHVRHHLCVVWSVAGYGTAHSAKPLEVSSSSAGCVATARQR